MKLVKQKLNMFFSVNFFVEHSTNFASRVFRKSNTITAPHFFSFPKFSTLQLQQFVLPIIALPRTCRPTNKQLDAGHAIQEHRQCSRDLEEGTGTHQPRLGLRPC